jgi:hypothetical protein
MMLRFCHFEIPNAKMSFDNLIVEFYMIPSGYTTPTWTAYAEFTTSTDSAAFERIFWSGTPMVLDATSMGTSFFFLILQSLDSFL